jgi:hypothetical protein
MLGERGDRQVALPAEGKEQPAGQDQHPERDETDDRKAARAVIGH